LIQLHLDAFSDCSSLKEITIPSNADVYIGASEDYLYFEKIYCSQLFQAIIAWDIPSVKKIFMSNSMMCMTITRNNWYLKEINLPKDFHPDLDHRACGGASLIQNYLDDYFHILDYDPVIRIDFNCQSLDIIVVSPQNPYVDSREDCNAVIETETNILFLGCCNTIVPNSVSAIADCAFQDCRKLKTIRIPDSVVAIGDYAFSGCYNLTEIQLPNSITSIGEKVFPHCKSFKKIIIPKGSRQRFIKMGLKEYSDILVEE
jgi:hypothetical protein